MLALTHHFCLQYAAYVSKSVPLGTWFKKYEILGDDIIIFDKIVAKSYYKIMSDLNVGINLSKSLVSRKGYGEFAKKLITTAGIVSGLSVFKIIFIFMTWYFLFCRGLENNQS